MGTKKKGIIAIVLILFKKHTFDCCCCCCCCNINGDIKGCDKAAAATELKTFEKSCVFGLTFGNVKFDDDEDEDEEVQFGSNIVSFGVGGVGGITGG